MAKLLSTDPLFPLNLVVQSHSSVSTVTVSRVVMGITNCKPRPLCCGQQGKDILVLGLLR